MAPSIISEHCLDYGLLPNSKWQWHVLRMNQSVLYVISVRGDFHRHSLSAIRLWICNYIVRFSMDVISDPCPHFKGGVATEVRHGWVTTSNISVWG